MSDRKPAKPLPLPEPGDIAAKFTWVRFVFVAGNNLLVRMDPRDSTKIMTQWRQAVEAGRETLFHVPNPDAPWAEYLFDSKRITYVSVLDDAHGWPMAKNELDAADLLLTEDKARANDLVIAKPKIEVVQP